MVKMKKGISPLVSYVLITGMVISSVGIVLSAGLPMLENMRDTAAVQQSITILTQLDSTIRDTASGGEYTTQSFTLRSRRGDFYFSEDENSIFFEIESDSGIISSNSKREIGPVTLSANAGSKVYETVKGSTPCYMMENKYLEACIRKVTDGFVPEEEKDVIGFWRMNSSSGQEVTDSSSGNNHGIRGSSESSGTDDPSWTEGLSGKSLQFDGQDDLVMIPDDDVLKDRKNLTLTMWINPSDTSGSDRDLVWKGSHSSEEPLGLWIDEENSQKFAFLVTDDENNYSEVKYSDTTIPEDRWTHLAVTFESENQIRMYINGSEDSNSPFPAEGVDEVMNTEDDIIIGSSASLTNYFEGKMDEIKVFNRALSHEDVVNEFHKKGYESYINSSELLVYYYNKNLEKTITPEMEVVLNGLNSTSAGNGFTRPEQEGINLGTAEVGAAINSYSGMDYHIKYRLPSGSDFLRIDIE